MNRLVEERELMIIAATLAQMDTPYFRVGTDAASSTPHSPALTPATLVRMLAQHEESRVREALIPLFLRHPEYHRFVPELALALPPDAVSALRHLYTAAVYLPHLWRSTLGLYLGAFTRLPDYYGQIEYGLPAPEVHWGEAGLRLLAARLERETGDNWLATYESAISRFLAQLQLRPTTNS